MRQLALLLCSLLTACGKPASPAVDPLVSFKLIADRCFAAFIASDTTVAALNGKFIRKTITPGETNFDVKKTDSLVSPYTSYIDISFIDQSMVASTPEAASTWEGGSLITIAHWRLVYAMQDGAWKLQDELYASALPQAAIKEGPLTKMPVGALVGSLPGASACNPVTQ